MIVAIFTIFLIGLLFLNYFPHPQLLTIFVSGKLNQYQQFYKNNKDFITSLGKSEKPWALKFVFGIGILLLKKKNKQFLCNKALHCEPIKLGQNDEETFFFNLFLIYAPNIRDNKRFFYLVK